MDKKIGGAFLRAFLAFLRAVLAFLRDFLRILFGICFHTKWYVKVLMPRLVLGRLARRPKGCREIP